MTDEDKDFGIKSTPVAKNNKPIVFAEDEDPIKLVEPVDWKKHIDKVAPVQKAVEEAVKQEEPTPMVVRPTSKPTPTPQRPSTTIKPIVLINDEKVAEAPVVTPLEAIKAEVKEEPKKVTPEINATVQVDTKPRVKAKVKISKSDSDTVLEMEAEEVIIDSKKKVNLMGLGTWVFLFGTVFTAFPGVVFLFNKDWTVLWFLLLTVPVGLIILIAGTVVSSTGFAKTIIDSYKKKNDKRAEKDKA